MALTTADKKWIAQTITGALKPIYQKLEEHDKKLDAIMSCPTIKKELKR